MHEQKIYFGAPGTGKSFMVEEKIKGINSDKVFRVTIHPEYTYSDFIGQLLPETDTSGNVTFVFKEGPFTRALVEAYSDFSKEVFLVLEELSRGNVAAIFGDVFQLLDRDEHFVSRYPIDNKNIADKIITLTSNKIALPSNLNILCTVNMNDQNVFPMDTAFKRRFEWEYVTTKPAIDPTTGSRNNELNNPKIAISMDPTPANNIEVTWQTFYTVLNLFITNKENGLGRNEDKQVGQFFINFGDKLTADSHSSNPSISGAAADTINNLIKNKLLIYLWQDVQGTGMMRGKSTLFDSSINSYEDLYEQYGKDKIFSDTFINDFLIPNQSKYPY